MSKTFTHSTFLNFRDFIHQNYGIYYTDAKKDLLKLKIDRCLRRAKFESYDEYFEHINDKTNNTIISDFVDEITVNKTEFFREIEHFKYLQANIIQICGRIPSIIKNKEIKVWSMACSTGQEAYTTAMILKEVLPADINIRVLATDISTKVLKIAKEGIYSSDNKNDIPSVYLKKYFIETNNHIEVAKNIKDLVIFRKFNLVHPFPFKSEFDIIFCKNVMIYFNLETQQQILDKIYKFLIPNGLFIIGQSEILLNKNHSFRHIKSTIYLK